MEIDELAGKRRTCELQELQIRIGDIAANLYDGGWRAADREQMIGYYTLTEDEAGTICELLEEYEIADREIS